jgi:hypothetical protein
MTTRVGVALMVSQIEYTVGPFSFFLAITNLSSSELTVRFESSQLYDFELIDDAGQSFWKWSDGQTFQPGEVTVEVRPSAVHVLSETVEELPVPPSGSGLVKVKASLTSTNLPFEGTLIVSRST